MFSSMGTKRALTIGISYAKSSKLATLMGTVNDSRNMTNLLRSYGFAVTHMNDVDYPANHPLFPIKNNIINCMTAIISATKSNDVAVITYSGHGIQLFYSKANPEELDGRDEAIIPFDYDFVNNAIIDDTIYGLLEANSSSKSNIFMLFDSCHSGTCADLNYAYVFNMEKFVKTKCNDYNFVNAAVIMLSGCKDNEVSWENYVKFLKDRYPTWQGFLTGAFISAVKSQPALLNDVFKLTAAIYITLRSLFTRLKIKALSNPVITSNVELDKLPQQRKILQSTFPVAMKKNIKPTVQKKLLRTY